MQFMAFRQTQMMLRDKYRHAVDVLILAYLGNCEQAKATSTFEIAERITRVLFHQISGKQLFGHSLTVSQRSPNETNQVSSKCNGE